MLLKKIMFLLPVIVLGVPLVGSCLGVQPTGPKLDNASLFCEAVVLVGAIASVGTMLVALGMLGHAYCIGSSAVNGTLFLLLLGYAACTLPQNPPVNSSNIYRLFFITACALYYVGNEVVARLIRRQTRTH